MPTTKSRSPSLPRWKQFDVMKNCLVVTGGAPYEKEKSFQLIEKILGTSYFVIAADSGLKTASDFGIKPNLIVGDFDSVERSLLQKFASALKENFIRDKDYSDTELALKTAKQRGFEKVVLLGGGGGRIDHLFSIERILKTDWAPDFWLSDGNVVALLKEGSAWEGDFSHLSFPETEIENVDDRLMISVFRVHGYSDYKIEDAGLFWPLENVDWAGGGYSLSNRPKSKYEKVALRAILGRFFVVFRT